MKTVSYSLKWPWAESCVQHETGTAYPWLSLPVLATPPRAAQCRLTGATRVRHAARTPHHAFPLPVPTRPHPMLGEDFWLRNKTEA
jgi:hypothetical protein